MQFMNVTLFKQSSLSNTAKHIASNHKINPGKNLAAQSREPKSLNPYVRLSSESNMIGYALIEGQ